MNQIAPAFAIIHLCDVFVSSITIFIYINSFCFWRTSCYRCIYRVYFSIDLTYFNSYYCNYSIILKGKVLLIYPKQDYVPVLQVKPPVDSNAYLRGRRVFSSMRILKVWYCLFRMFYTCVDEHFYVKLCILMTFEDGESTELGLLDETFSYGVN